MEKIVDVVKIDAAARHDSSLKAARPTIGFTTLTDGASLSSTCELIIGLWGGALV